MMLNCSLKSGVGWIELHQDRGQGCTVVLTVNGLPGSTIGREFLDHQLSR